MQERRRRRRGHFRRTAWTAGVVATAVGVAGLLGAPSASGQTEGFNRGTGSALAESVRLDPVAGGLSFGVGIGESLAGHQNTAATAEARSANMGVIGTTMAAEGCDGGEPTWPREEQPQALRVESGEENAEDGKAGQDAVVPGVDRAVRATDAPYAEALTSGGNLELADGVSIQGSRSFASSGVDGDLREAIARTEIDRLVIAGVVELGGMVWEAIHRSGRVDELVTEFRIGSLTIGGQAVPVDDPLAALSEANEALRPLGFELRPPRSHVDETSAGTLATVDPLGIRVIPSPTRDGVVNPVLSGAQDVRTDVFQALIDLDCGNATYITVLDIVLNAFGSGGYFAAELGGVQATTSAINRFTGLGTGGSLPPLVGALPANGTATGAVSGAAGGSTGAAAPAGAGAGTAAAPAAGAAAPIDDAVDAAADVTGSRGGALAGVAAAGLALLAVVAEGDRRKMRRAQREIPLEA